MRNPVKVARPAEIMNPDKNASQAWYKVVSDDDGGPAPSLKVPFIAGMTALILGFGGFFGWAYSASLDSAAVASGTVIVDSRRKTVSHLEGGILDKLLVHEGEVVKAGQPLIRLQDIRARTELQQLRGKSIGLRARLARLRAEQAGDKEITFPPEVLNSSNIVAADIISAERRFFGKRLETHEGRIAVQKKTIEQHVATSEALKSQIDANTRQKELIGEQLEAIRGLAAKGYAKRSQLLELEARWSELVGDAGELAANRAKSEQARTSAEIEIVSIETERQSEIAGDIQTAQLELNGVIEQIEAAQDVLKRVEVRSPQDGIVTNIQMRTPGGVVSPGQAIMDIVPENEPLIVEARVGPRDIDSVHMGADVQIRLTAYNHRSVAPLRGEVNYVAADQVVDPQSQAAYFVVRAQLKPDALKSAPEVRLTAGMPAELLILNKSRKAIDYLIAPISESFNRAFREE